MRYNTAIMRLRDRYYHTLSRIPSALWLAGALLVAALLKVSLLLAEAVPFNSDEAVVALMARHILQGERPIFFYGQAYMGSLDAFLVAFGFWVFGEHVWVIRLVQGTLYLGVIATTARLGKALLGSQRVGQIAAWMLAIPAVILTLYTTVSLGGYGEALLLGNLILLLGMKILNALKSEAPPSLWLWSLWGSMAGLGLWVFGLTLVYSIPVGLVLLWHLWRRQKFVPRVRAAVFLLFGVLVGALPWILYALSHDVTVLLAELGGSAIAGAFPNHWLVQLWEHVWTLILFGSTALFGLRPSWGIHWLALPLLPVVLVFWMAVLVHMGRRLRREQNQRLGAGLLIGVALTLGLGFVFTPFGGDPSGRYFLPVYIPMALFAAEFLLWMREEQGRWVWLFLGLVLGYNLWGTLQSVALNPPGITTQFDHVAQIDHAYMDELIEFLQANGETRGYTNYWISYPLAFRSSEEIIFIPTLPYHEDFRYTGRDDRYPPYTKMVAESERVAYITSNHPALDDWLRVQLDGLGVEYLEHQIGDYHLFYALSRAVRLPSFDQTAAARSLECMRYANKVEE
ncbi:MAG: hypothetical protein HN413_17460 [Chloroflexi bacterium]|jgi:4-amino-4-deoxy-L-arabinose transferase-like glycosyltransferase|nr:hypothetical protein [Chloroflexota bacterium]